MKCELFSKHGPDFLGGCCLRCEKIATDALAEQALELGPKDDRDIDKTFRGEWP